MFGGGVRDGREVLGKLRPVESDSDPKVCKLRVERDWKEHSAPHLRESLIHSATIRTSLLTEYHALAQTHWYIGRGCEISLRIPRERLRTERN